MSGSMGPSARGVERWSWADEQVAARIEQEQQINLTACYFALCRIAGREKGRDGFEVSMPALKRAMGAKDIKVARNAFWKLSDIGAIRVQERKIGRGQNLPHLVWLVEGAEFTQAEGTSSRGSTTAERRATPGGRETTEGGSSSGPPYVVSREDRTSSRGRRSEEEREEKRQKEPPEAPLSRKSEMLGAVDLDLSTLQANGKHREDGRVGPFVKDSASGIADTIEDNAKLRAAVWSWAGRDLNLPQHLRQGIVDVVFDIFQRPSRNGDPVISREQILREAGHLSIPAPAERA